MPKLKEILFHPSLVRKNTLLLKICWRKKCHKNYLSASIYNLLTIHMYVYMKIIIDIHVIPLSLSWSTADLWTSGQLQAFSTAKMLLSRVKHCHIKHDRRWLSGRPRKSTCRFRDVDTQRPSETRLRNIEIEIIAAKNCSKLIENLDRYIDSVSLMLPIEMLGFWKKTPPKSSIYWGFAKGSCQVLPVSGQGIISITTFREMMTQPWPLSLRKLRMLQSEIFEYYFGYFGNQKQKYQKQKYEIRGCMLVIKWQSKKPLRHMKKLTQTYRNVQWIWIYTYMLVQYSHISLKSSHIPVPVLPFGLSLPLQGLARPELQRSCETGSSLQLLNGSEWSLKLPYAIHAFSIFVYQSCIHLPKTFAARPPASFHQTPGEKYSHALLSGSNLVPSQQHKVGGSSRLLWNISMTT